MSDAAVGPASGAGFCRVTPFEVATGWLTGEDSGALAQRQGIGSPSPIETLESLLEPALAWPPCVVAFSGGRDSSVVLAVTTWLAHEERWREIAIGHIGVANWEKISVGDEADLLGPVGTEGLRRHGLLWPMRRLFKSLLADALLSRKTARSSTASCSARIAAPSSAAGQVPAFPDGLVDTGVFRRFWAAPVSHAMWLRAAPEFLVGGRGQIWPQAFRIDCLARLFPLSKGQVRHPHHRASDHSLRHVTAWELTALHSVRPQPAGLPERPQHPSHPTAIVGRS
jgi:asparagine synthase (glutamine-hydrolysing)